MFRDIYHQANDDIPVNGELLNSILNCAPKKKKYFYPRITAAASVFILAASILAYPSMKNNFTPENNPASPEITVGMSAVTQTSPSPDNGADAHETINPDAGQAKPNIEINAADKNNQNNAASDTKNTNPTHPPVRKTQKPAQNASSDAESDVTETPEKTVSPASSAENSSKDSAAAETNKDISPADIFDSEPLPSVKGLTSDEQTRSTFITETWTKEKYFEYIGRTIVPKIPQNMQDVTVQEKNMTLCADTKIPCYDYWSLKYESTDASKKASVRMTKNIQDSLENIKASSQTADIGGTKIALSGSENIKNAEGIKDGVSYLIETQAFSQEEFDDLVKSIFE